MCSVKYNSGEINWYFFSSFSFHFDPSLSILFTTKFVPISDYPHLCEKMRLSHPWVFSLFLSYLDRSDMTFFARPLVSHEKNLRVCERGISDMRVDTNHSFSLKIVKIWLLWIYKKTVYVTGINMLLLRYHVNVSSSVKSTWKSSKGCSDHIMYLKNILQTVANKCWKITIRK